MKHYTIRKIPTNIKNESLVKKRRQQIFEAVVKLFSKKGYHNTTLREISKASHITLGNLYDYISTKEDILYIIQERATQAVFEATSNNQDDAPNPVEGLKNLIRSELNAMDKYQHLILIIYQESHAMGKEVLRSLLENERRHIEQFEKVIKEGIRKGFFKQTNVRMLANMIKMLIDAWVIKRWDLRGKVTLQEMEKGILDIVLNGMIKSKYN